MLPEWSQQIKALRKAMRMSQKEFAKTIGFSIDAVFDWEHGYHKPGKQASRKLLDMAQIHDYKQGT